jgi:translation initiation factor 1
MATKPGPTPDRARPDGASPAASDSDPMRSSPFGALEALRSSLPPGRPPAVTPVTAAPPKAPGRAVVRLERKGRGGKEVTVVDKLGLRPPELEAWCRDLKQALGCGGAVDGELIVLQGDLRARVPAVLTSKGVAKVTLG